MDRLDDLHADARKTNASMAQLIAAISDRVRRTRELLKNMAAAGTDRRSQAN
jgi:hypothetical protein